MKTLISFIVLSFISVMSFAQLKKLAGKVISFEESLALEGVSVNVKGTSNYSGTQADGIFYITVKPEDKILVFSLPEYETKEIAITEGSDYNIILKRKGSGDNTKASIYQDKGSVAGITK